MPPPAEWSLLRVEDRGRAEHVCAHCRTERVRYVHVLRRHTGEHLHVGCVCAARLTGDADAVERQEQVARNRSKRFAGWIDPGHWTIEPDCHLREGRHFHWDYTLVIARDEAGWRWTFHLPHEHRTAERVFATPDEAKRDAWVECIEGHSNPTSGDRA